MRAKILTTILLSVFLIVGCSFVENNKLKNDTPIEKEETPEEIAQGFLEDYQELSYTLKENKSVFEGSFGSWKDALFVLYKDVVSAWGGSYGKILAKNEKGEYEEIHKTILFKQAGNETIEHLGIETLEITNADSDPKFEIVIISKGKFYDDEDREEFFRADVLDWKNDKQYLRPGIVRWALPCKDNVECVIKELKILDDYIGTYNAINEGMAGTLHIAHTIENLPKSTFGEYPELETYDPILVGTWGAVWGETAHTCGPNIFQLNPIATHPDTAEVLGYCEEKLKKIGTLDIDMHLKDGAINGEATLKLNMAGNAVSCALDCGSGLPDEINLEKK